MIKDKEYPATHSMATSWFAVDCEGNVALIDFNDNGPVPDVVGSDESFESIIVEHFVDKSSKIRKTILTEEQIDLLVSCLDFEPFNKDDEHIILDDRIWRINPQLKDDFFKIMEGYENSLVILSEEKGLYYIVYLSEKKRQKVFERICETKFTFSSAIFFIFTCIEEETDSNPPRLAEGFENLPMFIYAQEYWDPPLKRVHIPKHPIKANQLTEENIEKALHFPFSFRDNEQIPVHFYYPSSWFEKGWIPNNYQDCELEISKGNNTSFIRTNELTVPHCTNDYLYSHAYTFEPTVAIIKSEDCYIFDELPSYIFKYAFIFTFDPQRSNYLHKLIEFYRPYLFIVDEKVLSSLEKEFHIFYKKLIIREKEFPLFTYEEVEQHKNEILALAKMPYRGEKTTYYIVKKND